MNKPLIFLCSLGRLLGLVLALCLSFSPMAYSQWENDDTYDPFTDYSDYEATSEEEADINFFKNGRMLTLGLTGGYRNFSGKFGSLYGGGTNFGLFLSYFFDLKFALQFGFSTGDHTLTIPTPTQTLQGNLGLTDLTVNLKYYVNTQNVTKGLAKLNPYFLVGMSQIQRTTTLPSTTGGIYGKDSTNGLTLGGGIEIPAMRNKMYYGFQFSYSFVTFADENTQIVIQSEQTGIIPGGDPYLLNFILGVNF
ncbi:MAG: outer membrane beta-barrel protein [Pseudomonadota bacterium]|nr:outer membrane beta-barrel protein [Pseudomonadota bacterium]